MKEMRRQLIKVTGDVIGWQFSRTTNGRRTVRRRIYDIEERPDGKLRGKAVILGRIVEVVQLYTPYFWYATKHVGWTDD